MNTADTAPLSASDQRFLILGKASLTSFIKNCKFNPPDVWHRELQQEAVVGILTEMRKRGCDPKDYATFGDNPEWIVVGRRAIGKQLKRLFKQQRPFQFAEASNGRSTVYTFEHNEVTDVQLQTELDHLYSQCVSDLERDVLRLCHEEHLEPQAIGRRLGVSRNRVREIINHLTTLIKE